MEQTFTVSKFAKITNSILAIGLAAGVLFLALFKSNKDGSALALLTLFVLVAAWVEVNLFRNRVIITEHSVIRIKALWRKELLATNVKGFRLINNVIIIEPLITTDTRITITNYTDYANSDELLRLLSEKFADLDALEMNQEYENVVRNQSLEANPEVLSEKLKKYRRISFIFNGLGVATFGLAFVSNVFFTGMVFIIYPIIGVIIIKLSDGLVKAISSWQRSIYPSLAVGFYVPSIMLMIKTTTVYNNLQYANLFLPFILISIAFFLVLFILGRDQSKGAIKGQVVVIMIFSLLYGAGSSLEINHSFDSSVPQHFKAVIIKQHMIKGMKGYPYITLNEWYPGHREGEIMISTELYNSIQVGSTVTVNLKKGLFNIPWYYISK